MSLIKCIYIVGNNNRTHYCNICDYHLIYSPQQKTHCLLLRLLKCVMYSYNTENKGKILKAILQAAHNGKKPVGALLLQVYPL